MQVRHFASLVTGALDVGLQRELGIDEAAARLASVFLDGACAGESTQKA